MGILWNAICQGIGGFFAATWLIPGLVMFSALVIYILVKTIQEFRRK